MGVQDDEVAYIFWSGDPKTDSELQYTSHLIRESKTISGNKFWLNNDGDSQEYLEFSDGKPTAYYGKYNVGDENNSRVIRYRFKHVRRGDLPFVRLNYPGNK